MYLKKQLPQAGNDYLKVELSVTGEKYAGWKVRKNFNLWYQHADAQKQARSEVTQITILQDC